VAAASDGEALNIEQVFHHYLGSESGLDEQRI